MECDDVGDHYNGSDVAKVQDNNAHPTRCSSRDAASIIQNSSAHDGLLIITCDASGRGGGSKHDGIASILRIRHGASLLQNNTTTSQCASGKDDLMEATARRTVPSRTSSEVAAISLGIKRALRAVPASWRKRVLILTDSEFALDFFCGGKSGTFDDDRIATVPARSRRVGNNKRRRRKGTAASSMTQSAEHREEAHRRSLLALAKETPGGVLLSKVRSSSRGVGTGSSAIGGDDDDDDEVVGTSWNGIGFIDHDAADHLSSITRSHANGYEGDDKRVDMISNVAHPLGLDDIAWLENSDAEQTTILSSSDENETHRSQSDFWQTMEVVGSDARYDRRKRNQRRTKIIEDMLGSSGLARDLRLGG
eukprot:CAMPEP_0181076026 /NCGR_PEP_ID=MMETSP1071-20121207/195_1 /TAXON_ID=35127 /ORGANISM="Thalassiosira sp., Strain NH16" /LENGTH=364 /DNA_ID=CAMNT_0023157171 /DNA_START=262 /DNA_END=1356 /DNA_ORIENTATION=-